MKSVRGSVSKSPVRKTLKGAVMALICGSMLTAAGLAAGGRPVPGGALATGACEVFEAGSLFQDACVLNVAVANKSVTQSDAAYVGSCDLGGACADSVYNKLTSAAAKFAVPKVSDGCTKLASVQADLLAWNTATKQKINNSGYLVMTAAISAIQSGNCS